MTELRRVARPRLYHTKSRTGCTRCRCRRVKCDETRPVCRNCHRHGVDCEYDRVAISLSSPPPRSTGSGSSTSSTQTPIPQAAVQGAAIPQHEYWKLRVFHNFAVCTSDTLPGSHISTVKDCWSVQVPVLALRHGSLLNGILAISALHLLSSEHSDDAGLCSYRAMSLDAALETHREALSLVDGRDTADAACFTSILLLVDSFASLRCRPLGRPYQPPMQWLRLTNGVRCVLESSGSLVQTTDTTSPGSIMAIITSYSQDRYLSGRQSTGRFSHLLQPLPDETPCCHETLDAYRQAVSLLDSIQTAAESRQPARALGRGLMSFACLVPAQFLHLVEASEPRALVILSHLFALCAYARELWWVGDTPYREVLAIGASLPPTMEFLVEWPQKLVTDLYNSDKS
ncbi:hypothetical protein GGR57DRAFT_300853 [Xylariaceae sp. FL1272]|nr:hypothetical protein GGR57DRAFT_300853 [Xylariaceae sp. FL1272]